MKQIISIEIEIPAGYKFVAHKKATLGDNYLLSGVVCIWPWVGESNDPQVVVEKVEPKRIILEERRDGFIDFGDFYMDNDEGAVLPGSLVRWLGTKQIISSETIYSVVEEEVPLC